MLVDTQETRAFKQFLENEDLSGSREKIDDLLSRYRPKPGSLIPVLQRTQNIIGYLPPVVQNYIAQGLNLSPSSVYGVVSFYSFFTMKPRGRHVIRICLGTACYVKGGNKICKALQKELKIDLGETTKDRKFTLEPVRCLGACALAPVMVVNENVHQNLDVKSALEVLDQYE